MTNLVFKRGLIAIALCGAGIAHADESSSVAQPPSQTPGVAQMAPAGIGNSAIPAPLADISSSGCRQISTQAQIDGVTQVVQGVACPRPDGRWQISPDPGDMGPDELDLGDDTVGAYPVYPDYATYPGYYAFDPLLWYSPVVFGFGGSFVFVNHFDHFDHFHGFHHPYYGYGWRSGYQRVGARGFGNRGSMFHSFGGHGFGGGGFGRR
jgi:hypothetical protein